MCIFVASIAPLQNQNVNSVAKVLYKAFCLYLEISQIVYIGKIKYFSS